MPRLKRSREEAELPSEQYEPVQHNTHNADTLSRLRSMWEFASLMQYIFLFGHVMKIPDDFDVEDLEAECLQPQPSEKLAQIGLTFLKHVSSHRGLTPEIFDEYTRRQYVAKAPARNPFGEGEEPAKFNDFDVFTKIQVLQQLSTWTFGNVDRMRGMMSPDEDQQSWRMEPLGWDKEDRAYFVLDDNRLYCREDEQPPPPSPAVKPKSKAKAKSKASKKTKSRGTRSSKRRKVEETPEVEEEPDDGNAEAGAQEDTVMADSEVLDANTEHESELGYGFTKKTWSCVAVTLEDYQNFLATIFRSRDPNEKQLRTRIEQDVLPVIEKRAEALREKERKKLRELENMQKLATAKRSSRLAGKAEKEQQERAEKEADERRQAELHMAHEEQDRQRRIEEGHESRRLTREQRLKEREVKRILHEEELARLEEDAKRAASQEPNGDAIEGSKARMSERQVKAQREQHQRELDKLAFEEDKWEFDCAVCGLHGENIDDGTHSLACEKCNVWQHSKCHGLTPKKVEDPSFHFVCGTCKRKEEDAKKPKIAPLKLGKSRPSASPKAHKSDVRLEPAGRPKDSGLPPHVQRQLDGVYLSTPQQNGQLGHVANGPSLSPQGQLQGPPGYQHPPVSNFAPRPPQQPWQGQMVPPPSRPVSSVHGTGQAHSPPSTGSGYARSPPHQQQHQYAHQSAVHSSGGHPGYHFQGQQNGFDPRATSGIYSSTGGMASQQPYHIPPPSQQPYDARRLSYSHHTNAPQNLPPSGSQKIYQPQMQQQRRDSNQMMNGISPTIKQNVSASPPQLASTPSQQSGYRHHQASLAQSPHTSFPPPAAHAQQSVPSPAKSSPHPGARHHAQMQSPALVSTPSNTLRPSSANGTHAFETPKTSQGPVLGIVADGMSGPWPAGSKVIPQKHDQSPAPPSSAHAVGEMKIVPPIASLAPSPGQEAAGATGSIPVKKMPGEGSVANSSP